MLNYTRWNIILGWVSFLIALVTYLLTLEPTVSWWDCGEFIASSYKLQVGHPPGAPLYMVLGRFFSLFAGKQENVAMMINGLSATVSAFTILFLFWTITHLARRLMIDAKEEFVSKENMILILGSGFVGALAYTFSDTFWFSAVEAEVYATSSLFTAVVFWAILKWENISNQPHSDRWLILIAYLMGLSIGVHLLNLLAIPAIVMVYYFRKYEVTTLGIFKALLLSVFLIAVMMYGIIHGLVMMASKFELIFVNQFGLPFNSGIITYALLIITALIYGIRYTHKHRIILWNAVLVGFTVIIIGYSSYAMIVIRSLANPPMDENNPENVFTLLSYINREQYGDRPLLFGHYFNDEIERDQAGYPVIKEEDPVYVKDTATSRYRVAEYKTGYAYSESKKLFPRMYSRNADHIRAYREWGGVSEGEKPHFGNNLRFFLSYQLGHMYFRYFMWNFAGKQNDIQSHGSLVNGNWISGIRFLDESRVGNLDLLPDKYLQHEARNEYFLLPFLLGFLGMFFQYSKDQKNFWVTMLLFFFTGIAIVIYLNQTPFQPRERDYAYAGSFYAFSIWIGLGVLAIYDSLRKMKKGTIFALFIVLISLIMVPGLMAKENWNDHDRSGRYTARDIARNYLDTCDKNAVLFTNGDNDTFPLWYVQEVEGYRTDVRVVNLMLFNLHWYIEQMRKKAYESEALPFRLPLEKYAPGENSAFYILEDSRNRSIRLETIIEGIRINHEQFRRKTRRGNEVTVIPSNRFVLEVDTTNALESRAVEKEDIPLIENPVSWAMPKSQYLKGNLAQIDMLLANNWKRPVNFVAAGNDGALGLENYFQLDGIAYRMVPIETPDRNFFNYGRIEPEILYDRLMNDFEWGNMNDPDVYLDYYNIRTFSVIKFRKLFVRLAEEFIEMNKPDTAEQILDRCMELAPHSKIPFDYYVSGLSYPGENNQIIRQTGIIETYYRSGAIEKANNLALEFGEILKQEFIYYESLKERHQIRYREEYYRNRSIYEELVRITAEFGQQEVIELL